MIIIILPPLWVGVRLFCVFLCFELCVLLCCGFCGFPVSCCCWCVAAFCVVQWFACLLLFECCCFCCLKCAGSLLRLLQPLSEPSGSPLRADLAPHWAILALSRASLGLSSSFYPCRGAVLDLLGLVLGCFGTVLGCLGPIWGAQEEPQTVTNMMDPRTRNRRKALHA